MILPLGFLASFFHVVNSPTTFTSTESQRIKLSVQTLSDNSGNCIETTLLFDAIFEAIGFNTYFVFVTGHVFLAVQEWPNSDMVLPLETTLIGTETYDKARNVGLNEYQQAREDPNYFEFGVHEVRAIGVAPTPYMDKMVNGEDFYDKLEKISTTITSTKEVMDNVKGRIESQETIPPDMEQIYF